MHKIFFDANIINDIYDSKRASAQASYLCLKQCLEEGFEILTSCDIVTNVYYITAKYTDKSSALSALDDIERLFTILSFDNSILKSALKLMQEDTSFDDLEDTIEYVLAKESGCDSIVSNDKKFASKNLRVYTAEEFLGELG